MFQWFYWHSLLPGRDIPGIGAAMPGAGKTPAASTGAAGTSPAARTQGAHQ
jgi:sulfide:quinone oxidoreductase